MLNWTVHTKPSVAQSLTVIPIKGEGIKRPFRASVCVAIEITLSINIWLLKEKRDNSCERVI